MDVSYDYLSDQEWNIISQILPSKNKGKYNLRCIIDAIFYVLKGGIQWRNLPIEFPKWESVYYHFNKYSKVGILENLNLEINKQVRKSKDKESTPSLLSIDSQSIKTAPFVSKDTGYDGHKKIKGRKRHVVTDRHGLIWGVVITGANVHDSKGGIQVISPLIKTLDRMNIIGADNAYKGEFKKFVNDQNKKIKIEICSRPPTKKGFVPIGWRWVAERTFGTLGFFRRLSVDHEKTTISHKSWILWANCRMNINKIKNSLTFPF